MQASNLGIAGVRQSKLQEKEQKKLEREKQKQLKEQMKQQAEFEKSKKRIIQETIKNSRPGECLKVRIVLHNYDWLCSIWGNVMNLGLLFLVIMIDD